jgi:alpha-L-fucosidase
VKSVKHLVDIYYHSIGRNASFLLNFPVDQRGLIHETDVEQLMKMVEVIRKDLETDLARNVSVEADQVRGDSRKYDGRKAVDGNQETYWATDDGILTASLILDFGKEITFNRFLVREYIPLGQRVREFSIEAWVDGGWKEIDKQTTIGAKRILRFNNVSSQKLRFTVQDSRACPLISTVEVYHAPKLLEPPAIHRNKQGYVSLEAFDSDLDIYYTTDGSSPSESSGLYTESFPMKVKGEVRARVFDSSSGEFSEVNSRHFEVCKDLWKVLEPDPRKDYRGQAAIDDNPRSIWRSHPDSGLPQSMVVDLGEILNLKGFTYLPTQQRYIDGTISRFSFFVSKDGKRWGSPVSEGEFSNIKNSPILQTKAFDLVQGRYIRLVAEQEINNGTFASIAELGVITAD